MGELQLSKEKVDRLTCTPAPQQLNDANKEVTYWTGALQKCETYLQLSKENVRKLTRTPAQQLNDANEEVTFWTDSLQQLRKRATGKFRRHCNACKLDMPDGNVDKPCSRCKENGKSVTDWISALTSKTENTYEIQLQNAKEEVARLTHTRRRRMNQTRTRYVDDEEVTEVTVRLDTSEKITVSVADTRVDHQFKEYDDLLHLTEYSRRRLASSKRNPEAAAHREFRQHLARIR